MFLLIFGVERDFLDPNYLHHTPLGGVQQA